MLRVALAFCVAAGLFCHAQINPNRVAQLHWYQANTTATIPIPSQSYAQPFTLAFDGANVWAGSSARGILTKVRASDGAVLLTLALPDSIGTLTIFGMAFDGVNIWASMGNPYGQGGDYVASARAPATAH